MKVSESIRTGNSDARLVMFPIYLCIPVEQLEIITNHHYGLWETQTNFTYLLGTLDPCSRPSGWDTALLK